MTASAIWSSCHTSPSSRSSSGRLSPASPRARCADRGSSASAEAVRHRRVVMVVDGRTGVVGATAGVRRPSGLPLGHRSGSGDAVIGHRQPRRINHPAITAVFAGRPARPAGGRSLAGWASRTPTRLHTRAPRSKSAAGSADDELSRRHQGLVYGSADERAFVPAPSRDFSAPDAEDRICRASLRWVSQLRLSPRRPAR